VIEIRHRHTGEVLYTAQVETVREALEAAVTARANLAGANLARANLAGANLARANLAGANLARANLTGAYLDDAYLTGAYLTGANLTGAYLDGAYLTGAYLARANLAGANLTGANLTGAYLDDAYLTGAYLARANLTGANLTGAYLDDAYLTGAYLARANLTGAYLDGAKGVGDWVQSIRDDIRAVLDAAPLEVSGLLEALWSGKVDGSTYTGECTCLVGTIAKVRGVSYDSLGIDLRPDSSRPAERWFLKIRKGDTPVTNPSAAFAAAVIAQWQHEQATAKPRRKAAKVAP
jgi:uncharacterized protein YjbI with pentapeptide repeats